MPFWSGNRLVQELPKIIKPFNVDHIDCAAYTMTMGSGFYITPHEVHSTRKPLPKDN